MKITIRIPTREYAYFEMKVRVKDYKEAAECYQKAEEAYRGLSNKEATSRSFTCCKEYPKCNHSQPINN